MNNPTNKIEDIEAKINTLENSLSTIKKVTPMHDAT